MKSLLKSIFRRLTTGTPQDETLTDKYLKRPQDGVFENYHKVLQYFTPKSYLDIGVCKGWSIPFVKFRKLPMLEKMEMIEACRFHEVELKQLSHELKIPYHIEVLSDSVREVTFFLDGKGQQSTGPGNSYLLEDTPHYNNRTPRETRITNTLDNLYGDNVVFDLIKMDTQGSELDIIKGGLKLIRRASGLILEENIHRFNFNAPLHDEIRQYLEGIGFTLVEILDSKNYSIQNSQGETVPHHEIDTLYIRKDLIAKP